jgi:hypothetical protein
MKARIKWASDCGKQEIKDFKDYNELVEYGFSLNESIILENGQAGYIKEKHDVTMRIYDDYIE